MSAAPRRRCLACIVLAIGLLPGFAFADGIPAATGAVPFPWTGDPKGLHCLSLCELEDLYRRATVTCAPQGFLTGEVIKFTNMVAPELAKKLADRYWVGKHIEADGYFINQWKNRKALDSCLRIGPSYVDGQPALVFEYPWYTPLFGPMRDEYREIGPGLFLGKMYRRRPCVRFLGYNYLQVGPCGVAGCTPSTPGEIVEPPVRLVPAAPARFEK